MRVVLIKAFKNSSVEQLYDKATSADQMNGSTEEWLRTTVGVRHGCLLSSTFFSIFIRQIMSDALEEHGRKVSIGDRNITNLRFADDIDALAEEEQELNALVESVDKTCKRYQCREDQTDDKQRQWHPERLEGKRAETVTSSKYLETVVSDDGSKP